MEKIAQRGLNVIYLGGPTMILEICGVRMITDPTLDPKGSAFKINEQTTETKLAGPAIAQLGHIDLVLLSHDQHSDNLDKSGRELLAHVGNAITTKAGAARLKNYTVGLSPWEHIEIEALNGCRITVTATPARHGPAGSEQITGDVIGFLLDVSGNEKWQIYITGDTVFYEGVVQVANRFQPQYVFIFAGAAKPRGPFNVTMGSNDAIDTAFAFPDARIIPLHFEGWSHYTENDDVLRDAFTILGINDRLIFLEAGKVTTLPV